MLKLSDFFRLMFTVPSITKAAWRAAGLGSLEQDTLSTTLLSHNVSYFMIAGGQEADEMHS